MQYAGRLQTTDGDVVQVDFGLNGGRVSLRSGRSHLGSWRDEEVEVERLTLFRFRVRVEGEEFILVPDDPTGFAQATKASVDLRHRFGISDRLNGAPQASAR